MAKAPDISSKRLIGLAPEAWARWALGRQDVSGGEIISGEFQFLSRASDTLMRLTAPEIGEFLGLFEIQLRYLKTMPRRIRVYAALAEEKYNLPVYPVLVNVLPSNADEIAHRYESNVMGLYARQDYRVINLWEVPCEEVLRLNAPALLPFVPAMRGGATVSVVQQALEQLRDSVQLQEDERLKDAALALLSFARYSVSSDALQQLVRWVNMMDIVRESPLYQDIINQGMQEGIQAGLQQGLQQGMQQGRAEELHNLLLRQLTRRAGPLNEETRQALGELSFEQAETLAEDLLDFNGPADLAQWLTQKTLN